MSTHLGTLNVPGLAVDANCAGAAKTASAASMPVCGSRGYVEGQQIKARNVDREEENGESCARTYQHGMQGGFEGNAKAGKKIGKNAIERSSENETKPLPKVKQKTSDLVSVSVLASASLVDTQAYAQILPLYTRNKLKRAERIPNERRRPRDPTPPKKQARTQRAKTREGIKARIAHPTNNPSWMGNLGKD
ncbi:hypothetical protein K438DRAFT_1792004 [Mycena galopus ATCC 62051]|nr:hypothetical protein K438DRAFT_1792004 [Mycena galopus ATCC 62051]